MLADEIRNQVEEIWEDFSANGVVNPLAIIEQTTYLLFIKHLDELQTLYDRKGQMPKISMGREIFPKGNDTNGRPYEDLRWSHFKNFEPNEMMEVVNDHVFPFLRTLGAEGSGYVRHMRDARLEFSDPALLARVVKKLDSIIMEHRKTRGDAYEYMLSRIAGTGHNGPFCTPRHIIKLIVEMIDPQPTDTICDPASGTCGFLVAAGKHIRKKYPEMLQNRSLKAHFHENMFHGFDFDATMLRIGSMNLILHGIENPNVISRDSLAGEHTDDTGIYSLVLANPPFAGSRDYEATAKDLRNIVKTKKTELLFVALFLRLLKTGGRAATIVPDGVLFGSSKANREIRRMLVEEHKLDAVIKLPSCAFKPYTNVPTSILFFTKTSIGGTENVWFYNVQSDGLSLNDAHGELLPSEKLAPVPDKPLSGVEHKKNNLPDILTRWRKRDGAEKKNSRTAQSFCVHRREIVAADYNLLLDHYKVEEIEEIKYTSPKDIIAELTTIESRISNGLDKLDKMLK